MSPKIPLLRLPLLPFEKILDSLNLKDLIELSLLSEKLYERMHSSQVVKLNDVKMRVEIMAGNNELRLNSDSRGSFDVSTLHGHREMECLDVEYTEKPYVEEDEETVPTFRIVDWDRKNRKDDFYFWVEYFKTFFYVNSFDALSVSALFGSIDVDEFFKKDDLLRNAKFIWMNAGSPMSHEDTEFLLDNLSAEHLQLHVPLEDAENFQYNKKIRFLQMEMPNLSWLSEEQLLDHLTTTERIEVKDSPVLTESFLNKFLKQWFTSFTETYQVVTIWSKPYADPSEIPVFDKKKVLEGITGKVTPDFWGDDTEEQSLMPAMRISRDKDSYISIKLTKRMNKLFFHSYFCDRRKAGGEES